MTRNTKLGEVLTDKQIQEHKKQILELLDACEARTIKEAANKVGISPSSVYYWCETDKAFARQVHQRKNVLADKLIVELLDADPDSKMPFITAKIFLIKGLKPEFRDSHKIIELKDEKTRAILEELQKLAKKQQPASSSTSEVETEPLEAQTAGEQEADNPFVMVVKTIESKGEVG